MPVSKLCIQFFKKQRKRLCEFIEGLLIHVTDQVYIVQPWNLNVMIFHVFPLQPCTFQGLM
jgi:hypothetical protein